MRRRVAIWGASLILVIAFYLWAPFPASWPETVLLLVAVALAAAIDLLTQ